MIGHKRNPMKYPWVIEQLTRSHGLFFVDLPTKHEHFAMLNDLSGISQASLRQLLVPVTPVPSPDVRGHLELKNVDFSDLVDVADM